MSLCPTGRETSVFGLLAVVFGRLLFPGCMDRNLLTMFILLGRNSVLVLSSQAIHVTGAGAGAGAGVGYCGGWCWGGVRRFGRVGRVSGRCLGLRQPRVVLPLLGQLEGIGELRFRDDTCVLESV